MDTTQNSNETQSGRAILKPIIGLEKLITGQLSDLSLNFINEVNLKNKSAFNKLLNKLEQSKINLEAEHINQIILSLLKPKSLPNHLLKSIDSFLTEQPQLLETVLELHNTNSELAKLTQHLMNNLNLFNEATPQAVLLTNLVSLLVNFQDKNRYSNQLIKDSENWLSTALSISSKSDLSKLINFLSDRLALGITVIKGNERSMDLSELFFLFEDLALQANITLHHESNAKLIHDMNAILLLLSAYQINPIVFYDVVILQHQTNKSSILQTMKQCGNPPLLLEYFFNSSSFQAYFRKGTPYDDINQDAFLTSFLAHIEHIQSDPHHLSNIAMAPITAYLDLYKKQSEKMDDLEFQYWLEQFVVSKHTQQTMTKLLLNAIEKAASLNLNRVGSLLFSTNKLVSLGFSPRSATMATTGHFQPLINSEVPKKDAQNFKALKQFFDTLKPNLQKKFTFELLLCILVHHRITHTNHKVSLIKIEKIVPRSRTGMIYPTAAITTVKKIKPYRTARIARKQPSYTCRFFDGNKPIQKTTRWNIRQSKDKQEYLPL